VTCINDDCESFIFASDEARPVVSQVSLSVSSTYWVRFSGPACAGRVVLLSKLRHKLACMGCGSQLHNWVWQVSLQLFVSVNIAGVNHHDMGEKQPCMHPGEYASGEPA
jgi:hypothetical protein